MADSLSIYEEARWIAGWQTADGCIRFDEEQIAELEAVMEKTKLLVRYTSSVML